MTDSKTSDSLVKELSFQLTVTRAMLKTVELDQILYIILSGITHGDGLNFNRAVLFLAWDRRNELRVSRSAGPANGAEAHRIWEGIKAEKLDLQSLIDRYTSMPDEIQYLTGHLLSFALKLEEAKPLDSLEHMSFELRDIISHCVATKQPFIVNGIEATYLDLASNEQISFKNFAVVPIILNNEVFGVILTDNMFNSRIIASDELRGLSTVANLASIALERAMLYRKLTEMAQVDGLTGVFNRRYYERYLHDEFLRSKRLHRALSMIVFDIDLFKRFNDTYGHECGDRVLKEFAHILKTNTRESDMVARYGGEEFVVLLTGEQSSQDAWAAGEKLRRCIEMSAFTGFNAGQITASAGVAIVGPEEDFAQLFARADQALYDAKRDGRNCVRLYDATSFTS